MGKKKRGVTESAAIRVLLADGFSEQLHVIRRYGDLLPDIRVVGAASDGGTVIQALNDGVEADVLVMDTLLKGRSALEVLHALQALPLGQRLCVIMTSCQTRPEIQQKYLDAGADLFLAKPYTAEGLFENVRMLVSSSEEYRGRRTEGRIHSCLKQLRLMSAETGYEYIMCAEKIILERNRPCSLNKEVYLPVAQQFNVTANAVESGIRRAIEYMTGGTDEGEEALRLRLKLPKGKRISNRAFLNGLAQTVRGELGLDLKG